MCYTDTSEDLRGISYTRSVLLRMVTRGMVTAGMVTMGEVRSVLLRISLGEKHETINRDARANSSVACVQTAESKK